MKALISIILCLSLLIPFSVNTVFAENVTESTEKSKASSIDDEYPEALTKKGLEVQYITDATLLGVGHTVLHVNLNDLVCSECETAISYEYNDITYYIDADALTLLDYRIKTLTDAGIHIYINYILSFDSSAPSELYYPDAKGSSATLYAPNVSTPERLTALASVFNFIAKRYTSGENGFCGSYIIGYEVNNEEENNSAAIKDLKEYVSVYSTLLEAAYNSVKNAYANSKIYISLSNEWNISSENEKQYRFSSKDFLDELINVLSDVPFGIAINPYPSSLNIGAFWLDDKATDSIDTEYVTMKNINVLTDYLTVDKNLVNGQARSVVISEFGISGEINTESEKLQAAAYAYSYYIAENNPLIEAFIWHRHVDHISEYNLNYGLYSSSELALDAKDKKLIHKVFSLVDLNTEERNSVLQDLLQYLPFSTVNELISEAKANREYFTESTKTSPLKKEYWKAELLFDFSTSLYSFYPSDNSEYIERMTENGIGFMRIVNLMQSSVEYMGAGIKIDDYDKLHGKEFITVKIRVVSSANSNDFSLVITGSSNDVPVILNCKSNVTSNEWVTLTFDISKVSFLDLNNCSLKLWVRSDSSKTEQVFLDVSSITLHSKKSLLPFILIVIVITLLVIAIAFFIIYIMIQRKKRIAREKAKARARAQARQRVQGRVRPQGQARVQAQARTQVRTKPRAQAEQNPSALNQRRPKM